MFFLAKSLLTARADKWDLLKAHRPFCGDFRGSVFTPKSLDAKLWSKSLGERAVERSTGSKWPRGLCLNSAQRCVLFYLLCFGLVWVIFPCPKVWADYKATSNSPGQIETEAEDRSSPFVETKHGAGERGRKSDYVMLSPLRNSHT